MPISVIKKEGDQDRDACLALSLLMAMHSLGRDDITKEQVYSEAECVGEGNLALPWGICKAAHKFGFSILHGSKNPYRLVDYRELKERSGMSETEAQQYVGRLINFCRDNYETISLAKYPKMHGNAMRTLMQGYLQFMEYVVENELGVVFVTLRERWPDNHTLPVQEFSAVDMYLVNCNEGEDDILQLSRDAFERAWNDSATDNDFFILWKPAGNYQ